MSTVRKPDEEAFVLTRKKYEAIIENLEDLEDMLGIAQERLKRLEMGAEAYDRQLVPHAVATRIWNGESPVRVWRKHRGMTGRALAAAAGITPAFLSEIENGKKQPSMDTFKALAKALEIDLDSLAGDRRQPR